MFTHKLEKVFGPWSTRTSHRFGSIFVGSAVLRCALLRCETPSPIHELVE